MLKLVAATLAAAMRTGDAVARIGGEEFAVILPDTDAEAAHAAAERVRAAVAAASEGTTTVSVGAAVTDGAEDSDRLLTRTDRAMYAAKRAGRDRVAVAA